MIQRLVRTKRFWTTLGILSLVVFVSGESVRYFWRQRGRLHHNESQRRELTQRVTSFEARLKQSTEDSAGLERAARSELCLLRPGEIEFRFIDPSPTKEP